MSSRFEFRDLTYSVKVTKEGSKTLLGGGEKVTKNLIEEINGAVNPGEMLAILGPSGAGKTSFLDAVTFQGAKGANIYGQLFVGGERITTKEDFKQSCVYIPQHSENYATLTPRQTLRYYAELCTTTKSGDRQELIDKKVTKVLEMMGLVSCADVKIGSFLIPGGLSGGQSKRLSVAIGLLKDPKVIILDEPTSGLDSAAAASVIKSCADLAKEFQKVVILTIHQPPIDIFQQFHKTMLLSQGKLVYFGMTGSTVGKVDLVNKYFADFGHPVPPFVNPADHFLELINSDFRDPEEVNKVIDYWVSTGQDIAKMSDEELSPDKTGTSPQKRKSTWGPDGNTSVNFFYQFQTLFRRHSWICITDPLFYWGRALAFWFSGMFFCIVYIEARNKTQEQALSKLWAVLWCLGTPACIQMLVSIAFNLEFKLVRREIDNGFYTPAPYLLAHWLISMVGLVCLTLCSLVGTVYGVLGYNWDEFGTMFLVFAGCVYAFETFAQLASLDPNLMLGVLNHLNYWFATFLFCGVMIRRDDVIWPLRIFAYMSPFSWTIPAVAKTEFRNLTFPDAAYTTSNTQGNCALTIEQMKADPENTKGWERGCFECNDSVDLTKTQCYGHTGNQILHTTHKTLSAITAEDIVIEYMLITFAIAFAQKFLYVAGFYYRVYVVGTQMKDPATKGKSMMSPTKASPTKNAELNKVEVVDPQPALANGAPGMTNGAEQPERSFVSAGGEDEGKIVTE